MKKYLQCFILFFTFLIASKAYSAWSDLGNLTGCNSTTSGTSLVCTLSATIEVGNILMIAIAKDNACTSDYLKIDGTTTEVTGIVDTTGINVYKNLVEVCYQNGSAANTVSTLSVWYSKITSQLDSGQTFTISHVTATSRAARMREYSIGSGKIPAIAPGGSGVGYIAAELSASLNASSLQLSGLTSKEYLFLRCNAGENDDTSQIIGTTNFTAWATGSSSVADTTVTGTSQNIRCEFRINTSTGETSAFTDDTPRSHDAAEFMMALEETDPPSAGRKKVIIIQ